MYYVHMHLFIFAASRQAGTMSSNATWPRRPCLHRQPAAQADAPHDLVLRAASAADRSEAAVRGADAPVEQAQALQLADRLEMDAPPPAA
jgi:hypothetical protein